MDNKIEISIVSPIYKGENTIEELVSRIIDSIKGEFQFYEIILVDDYSPDSSWDKILEISKINPSVKGIKLSKNFGQHYAIAAGIENSIGEWVVVLDCDLQDRPEEILNLYNKAKEGFDVVLAKRSNRQDNFIKRSFSYSFYFVLTYLTEIKYDETIANFGIYHRKVIDQICKMPEKIRFFPTMVHWVGFNQTKLEVEHAQRLDGKSNYNLKKLFNLALEIILSNSDKPIRLVIKFGLLTSFLSFFYALFIVFKYIKGEVLILGYSSLIVSICFFSGIIIIILGIIGLYLGKTFEGVKNRPYYIIDRKTIE